MAQPLGREAMRKTLENLKVDTTLHLALLDNKNQQLQDTLLKIVEILDKGTDRASSTIGLIMLQRVTDYSTISSLVLGSLVNYILALEAYTSDLDSTFDELLKVAKEKAEAKVKEEAGKRPKQCIVKVERVILLVSLQVLRFQDMINK